MSDRNWQRGLTVGLVAGAILISEGAIALEGEMLRIAQIVPDDTLGNERSVVTPGVTIRGGVSDRIDGGAARGANLFHSFREFNVNDGQRVYFSNPAGVENILSRVTGNNVSNILGTLGVDGAANLFLLNPNGIIFGPNAQLDVGGSFVASTANTLQFGDQGFFSATNPEAPSSLLTINPSAFLFNQINPGNIDSNFAQLQVSDHQNLTLLGGNVNITGGSLSALGGRIDIGATASTGAISLNADGSFSIPDEIMRGDVLFNNGAVANTSFDSGGNIAISARNITFLNRGSLLTGIASNSGTADSQAGNLVLDATGDIQLLQANSLLNVVGFSATGNSGDINIRARSLSIKDGSQISTGTFGQGNAGNLIIDARDIVSLNGRTTADTSDPTGVSSIVTTGAIGNGGDIRITTGSLSLTNFAALFSDTFGRGDAGNIIITARDAVSLGGANADRLAPSAVSSSAAAGAIGNGGDIRITTGSLSLTSSAILSSSTSGRGDAGNIIITARDAVSLDGTTTNDLIGVSSIVASGAIGNGGDIRITTGSLSLTNAVLLSAGTNGEGNAGNIFIDARDRISLGGIAPDGLSTGIRSTVEQLGRGQGGSVRITTGSLSLSNGTQISAGTFGEGNAGNVIINARNTVSLDGTTADGSFSSSVSSSVETGAIGNSGNIRITTEALLLTNGAQINAGTSGQGNAGGVIINAHNTVSIDDGSANGRIPIPSGVFSSVDTGAIGNGGDVRITTGSLALTNGAQISASTFSQGDAGNVSIEARGHISLDGVNPHSGFPSRFLTRTFSDARGQGGNVTIATNSFRISNGAIINAQTSNAFRGGNVTINANTFEATRGGQVIATTTNRGQAGTITLNIRDNLLLSGSDPTFAVRQRRFPDAISNQGADSGLFASTVRNSSGQGGTIRINTDRFRVEDGARVEVNSLGSGAAGDVRIRAGSVRLSNRGRLIAETQTVDGGNIVLTNLDQLLLREQSSISTNAGTTGAGGDGGNIGIDADFIVAVPTENSDITANAVRGNGGRVNVTTQGLFGITPRESLTPLSDITASSEQGVQGVVAVNTPNVDPRQGLLELPTDVTDATQQIAQNCPTDSSTASELGEFVVTGRGGLPPSPTEVLGGETVLTQLADADSTSTDAINRVSQNSELSNDAIAEAQSWVIDADGQVSLIAHTPQSPSLVLPTCTAANTPS
ncbi:filamentous hemagglutinin N-terminal domain-containing protein [Oscillatoria sp. FACHB-1407]|uniref:two-partner secretion domain-containing protein n=1 Tax=Oscillatoria sp. FACHB-1407 TaxID=2692847 RepID=UPI0016820197|nr:filamentous hemagglutinin N-terminal domain-containing protein [Oscillatoria sp. FACHB-1407]MBD2463038.1 filamentous hemagglutinin N-terminal domain-containing protein [Oscillatoria sp. FACHB-1407]